MPQRDHPACYHTNLRRPAMPERQKPEVATKQMPIEWFWSWVACLIMRGLLEEKRGDLTPGSHYSRPSTPPENPRRFRRVSKGGTIFR